MPLTQHSLNSLPALEQHHLHTITNLSHANRLSSNQKTMAAIAPGTSISLTDGLGFGWARLGFEGHDKSQRSPVAGTHPPLTYATQTGSMSKSLLQETSPKLWTNKPALTHTDCTQSDWAHPQVKLSLFIIIDLALMQAITGFCSGQLEVFLTLISLT